MLLNRSPLIITSKMSQFIVIWGGGGNTPYDRLYREALPERGPFSGLRYKKGYRKIVFVFWYFKGSVRKAGLKIIVLAFYRGSKTGASPRS